MKTQSFTVFYIRIKTFLLVLTGASSRNILHSSYRYIRKVVALKKIKIIYDGLATSHKVYTCITSSVDVLASSQNDWLHVALCRASAHQIVIGCETQIIATEPVPLNIKLIQIELMLCDAFCHY